MSKIKDNLRVEEEKSKKKESLAKRHRKELYNVERRLGGIRKDSVSLENYLNETVNANDRMTLNLREDLELVQA